MIILVSTVRKFQANCRIPPAYFVDRALCACGLQNKRAIDPTNDAISILSPILQLLFPRPLLDPELARPCHPFDMYSSALYSGHSIDESFLLDLNLFIPRFLPSSHEPLSLLPPPPSMIRLITRTNGDTVVLFYE